MVACGGHWQALVSNGSRETFRNFHSESYQSFRRNLLGVMDKVVGRWVRSIPPIHGYRSINPSTNISILMNRPRHVLMTLMKVVVVVVVVVVPVMVNLAPTRPPEILDAGHVATTNNPHRIAVRIWYCSGFGCCCCRRRHRWVIVVDEWKCCTEMAVVRDWHH